MRYFPKLRTNRFFILSLIVMSIIGALYQILFSPWGNALLTQAIEKTLSSRLSVPLTIEEFTLTPNHFSLRLHDDSANILRTEGEYSLLTLNVSAYYQLNAPHKGGMNRLNIPWKTDGAVSGEIGTLSVRGKGDVFGGTLLYRIQLQRFQLASLRLQLNDIAYAPILHLLDYPSDTDTALSGRVDLYGFHQRHVEGTIRLTSTTERFAPTPIEQDDDNESFDFKTLLADEFGHIKAFNVAIALDASLAHAGILEQFVGIPLAGAITLKGTLKGDEKLLRLRATSDVAQSDTSFTLLLRDLEPSSIVFDLKHGDAQKTFDFFALPSPIKGEISAFAELNTSSGHLNVAVRDGETVPRVLQQTYHITQPLIHFNGDLRADIMKKEVRYRAAFKSDLNRLEIDNTTTHDQMLRELLKTLR